MTPQPQPTEYIITMARIIKARNMLMVDGYKNADVLDRMVNLLRSRPKAQQVKPARGPCKNCTDPNQCYTPCQQPHPISTNGTLPEVEQVPDGSSRAPESGMCKGSSINDGLALLEKEIRKIKIQDEDIWLVELILKKIDRLRGEI